MDVWYNSSYNNYIRLLDALEELGQDISSFKAEKSPNPKTLFFKLDYDKFTVDFLPELPGLSKFRDSYNKCEVSKIGEIEVAIISNADLIVNKQIQRQVKDLLNN